MACGKYMLQNTDALSFETTPPNTALDVYINEWVKIQPFPTWWLLSNKILASQNQPFRTIRSVSQSPGTAE